MMMTVPANYDTECIENIDAGQETDEMIPSEKVNPKTRKEVKASLDLNEAPELLSIFQIKLS
jgi:hypothetical protein